MRKLQLKPNYALTATEVELMQSLAAHTHDAKYSTAQSRGINNIYYRIFGVDELMLMLAGKTRFADGKAKTTLHRQRDVLQALLMLQMGIATPPADYLTLLLNTMAASNPLNVMLVGLALEAYDAVPTPGEYLHLFDVWATDPNLSEVHDPVFVQAVITEYDRIHAAGATPASNDEGGRPATTSEGHEG